MAWCIKMKYLIKILNYQSTINTSLRSIWPNSDTRQIRTINILYQRQSPKITSKLTSFLTANLKILQCPFIQFRIRTRNISGRYVMGMCTRRWINKTEEQRRIWCKHRCNSDSNQIERIKSYLQHVLYSVRQIILFAQTPLSVHEL